MVSHYKIVTIYSLVLSSADNFCKLFGSRSGLTKYQTRSGSKLFDTCKKISKKMKLKENQQTTKKHENYPMGKELSDLVYLYKM